MPRRDSHYSCYLKRKKSRELLEAKDQKLSNLRGLRKWYWRLHPILLDEVARGVLKPSWPHLSKRIGCSIGTWRLYISEDPTAMAELLAAKSLRLSSYDSGEALTGLPSGYEAL